MNKAKRVFAIKRKVITNKKQVNFDKSVKILSEKIVFSKDDYNSTLKEKRKEFLKTYLNKELENIFLLLKRDANNMKMCNLTSFINIPEHLNIEKIESILKMYFEDLGYCTVCEIDKEKHVVKIVLM